MSDVSVLMDNALKQLEEHKVWLKEKMHEHMNAQDSGEWKLAFRVLISQVDDMKLRMSRVDSIDSISIVWEYPDELLAYLASEKAPEHLRRTLEGGRLIDPNQPASSAKSA